MEGYSSDQRRNLNMRCPKFWKWVDWVMSESCQQQNLKKDVVLGLLPKTIPTLIEGKVKLEGEMAYAKRVFDRLGIPLELEDASAN